MSKPRTDRAAGHLRRPTVMGAVGLVAILGVGTLAANQLLDDADTGGSTPPGVVSSDPPGLQAAPAVPPGDAAAGENPDGVPTGEATAATPRAKTTAERVAAGQSAAAEAAKNGYGVRRPLPVRNGGAVAAAAEVKVTESGSVAKNGRSLKVISARQDLTGQRELAWVADKGERVGSSFCSNKIRLSTDAKPRVRPTLLLCWRVSAAKTVYTVAVDVKRAPSKRASVAEIDRVWSKLG